MRLGLVRLGLTVLSGRLGYNRLSPVDLGLVRIRYIKIVYDRFD